MSKKKALTKRNRNKKKILNIKKEEVNYTYTPTLSSGVDKKIAKLLGINQVSGHEVDKSSTDFSDSNVVSKSNLKSKLAKNLLRSISRLHLLYDALKVVGNLSQKFVSSFFDSNEKQIKKLEEIVKKVEDLEEEFSQLSQEEMINLVAKLRREFQAKLPPDAPLFTEKNKAWLKTKQGQAVFDFIMEKLPVCFALVREVAKRTSDHRHFKVQLMAGVALVQGRVIEFKTGEGKTLVATLVLFMYSLFGRGAYLVTVNDYLARRDGEWVGHMLGYLGISVGVLNSDKSYKYVDPEFLKDYGKSPDEIKQAFNINWAHYNELKGLTLVEVSKKEAYLCDITYGTNSEFGFDYLRDNRQMTFEDMNQRPPFFCIVDEVDSILIDESRVPLIISDVSSESNELYVKFAKLVKKLEKSDYVVDEKDRAVTLTQSGIKKMEEWLGVDNIWQNHQYAKHLDRALLAEFLYKKDDHYIVHNGEVIIVDEFTGRLQIGRRYSDGIHQAIEAKEGLVIRPEARTIATITYQNYFRLFPILSGMTGTALTEAEEFGKIYNLEVVAIPTNKPMIRKDLPDVMYKDEDSKFKAVVNEISEKHSKGQPILVGTVSVEKSEKLSKMLKQVGIKHEVLNAKNHAREAEIVAKAGQKYAVTISTNMAGRGTDIRLGPGVKELGGLYVIGTEKHESRRIDNQLRGRAGRQGDPGMSRFFLAFDDEVLRVYGGDIMKKILNAGNIPSDIPFQSNFLSRLVESAQKRIEAENFDIRKYLVEYDDVLNKQRLVIYNRRRRIIELFDEAEAYYRKNKEKIDEQVAQSALQQGTSRLRDYVIKKVKDYISNYINFITNKDKLESEHVSNIISKMQEIMPPSLFIEALEEEFNTSLEEFKEFLMINLDKERVKEQFLLVIDEAYDLKEKKEGFMPMRLIEKYVMLDSIDNHWVTHLQDMEILRSGISFQGYGQRDPLNIYQNEGYTLFSEMIKRIDEDVASRIMNYTAYIERKGEEYEQKAQIKELARQVHTQPWLNAQILIPNKSGKKSQKKKSNK